MTIAWAVLLDERDVTFDAKVTTTSDIDATIAPPIAWRGLQYIGAGTVPMAGGLVVGGVFGNASRHFIEPAMCRRLRIGKENRHIAGLSRCGPEAGGDGCGPPCPNWVLVL